MAPCTFPNQFPFLLVCFVFSGAEMIETVGKMLLFGCRNWLGMRQWCKILANYILQFYKQFTKYLRYFVVRDGKIGK